LRSGYLRGLKNHSAKLTSPPITHSITAAAAIRAAALPA
jgi:hypothetical protein